MARSDKKGFGSPIPEPLTTLNPHQWYEEMRESNPVWYDENTGLWFLFRYDDVKRAFEDHTTFSAAKWSAFDANQTLPSPTMMDADPPEHQRLRSPVNEPFLPGTVRDRESEIRDIVDRQLEEVARADEFDFAEEFTRPVTIRTILTLLGIPQSDWELLRNLQEETDHFHREGDPPTKDDFERAGEATEEMLEYFDRLLEGGVREDGLISRVADAKELSRDEKLSLCVLLFRGGNNNTMSALTNTVWVLAEQDHLPSLLAGELDHNSAFDEVLRYRTPLQFMAPRATIEDVSLGQTTIPTGEPVALMIESANNDPRQFENPREYKPDRKPNNHLAFGSGNHRCLGWALARLEGKTMLDALSEKCSEIHVETTPLEARPGPNSTPQTLPTRIELV